MSRKYILPSLLILQFIGLKLLSYLPEFVENHYSNGLYIYISHFSRNVLGWIPFSVGDILYGILIIWIILWLKKHWKTTSRKEKTLAALSLLSVIYFLFHFLWAFNYYRMPLFEKMQLKTEYSDAQLLSFTKKLIEKTNQTQLKITGNSITKVSTSLTHTEIFKKSLDGYNLLAQKHPDFTYTIPSQKESLISLPLTYMGFGGYLNPFTNEAQVNNKLPLYSFPATACHEMAHQIGYGSESECNFIGFLASTQNKNLHFRYSGYTHALRYCLKNIGIKDERQLQELVQTINPGVLKNFKESEDFWKSHQTFIDDGFEIFYDSFLKMNQQKDGMESYSKFVDLLINYYEKETL